MVLLKKYWQCLILTNTAAVQMLFKPHFCFDCRTCTVVFHPPASRFKSVRQQWLGRVSLDALHQKLGRHLLYLIQQSSGLWLYRPKELDIVLEIIHRQEGQSHQLGCWDSTTCCHVTWLITLFSLIQQNYICSQVIILIPHLVDWLKMLHLISQLSVR